MTIWGVTVVGYVGQHGRYGVSVYVGSWSFGVFVEQSPAARSRVLRRDEWKHGPIAPGQERIADHGRGEDGKGKR